MPRVFVRTFDSELEAVAQSSPTLGQNLAKQNCGLTEKPNISNSGYSGILFAVPTHGLVSLSKVVYEVIIMNGLLVQPTWQRQSAAPSTGNGQVWNSLQDLKEKLSKLILADGPLCQNQSLESSVEDVCTSNDREIGWLRRSQLEQRLLAITDAQDRLFNGDYGRCTDCGEQISSKRLAADPAVSLCIDCQRITDGEHAFPTM